MDRTTLDILLLSLGVFVLLIALTMLGEGLRARVPQGRTNPVIEAFMMRVNSWWALVITLALAVLIGPVGVILLFAFALGYFSLSAARTASPNLPTLAVAADA